MWLCSNAQSEFSNYLVLVSFALCYCNFRSTLNIAKAGLRNSILLNLFIGQETNWNRLRAKMNNIQQTILKRWRIEGPKRRKGKKKKESNTKDSSVINARHCLWIKKTKYFVVTDIWIMVLHIMYKCYRCMLQISIQPICRCIPIS